MRQALVQPAQLAVAAAPVPRLADPAAGAAAPSPASNAAQPTAATATRRRLARGRTAGSTPAATPALIRCHAALRHHRAPSLPIEYRSTGSVSAGYGQLTRESQRVSDPQRPWGRERWSFASDLRQFTAWCHNRQLGLLAVRRAGIECFARELEAAGRARATVTRRSSTIAGLYNYAVHENLLDHSPAAHVRGRARPDLFARPQWASGVGGHRRRHRGAGHGVRAPHPDHCQARRGLVRRAC